MSPQSEPWIDWERLRWKHIRAQPFQFAFSLVFVALLLFGLFAAAFGILWDVVQGRLVAHLNEGLNLERFNQPIFWWLGGGLVALVVLVLALSIALWCLAWIWTFLRLPFLLAGYLEAGARCYAAQSRYYEAKHDKLVRDEAD